MSKFLVSVIDQDGKPKRLFGQYADFGLAEADLFEVLQSKTLKLDFSTELDNDLRSQISMDGLFEFADDSWINEHRPGVYQRLLSWRSVR